MDDILTFDNFFDKFPLESDFAKKGYHSGGNEYVLQSKMFGEYCRTALCTIVKDDSFRINNTLFSCFWNSGFNLVYRMKLDAHFLYQYLVIKLNFCLDFEHKVWSRF